MANDFARRLETAPFNSPLAKENCVHLKPAPTAGVEQHTHSCMSSGKAYNTLGGNLFPVTSFFMHECCMGAAPLAIAPDKVSAEFKHDVRTVIKSLF